MGRRQDPEVGGVLPPETYQNAIGSGAADANGLTTFTGCNGQDVCVFDSILFAQFYETVGQVSGDGLATLQFDTARRARALKGSARQLQAQDAASASEFGLNVDVNALNDGPGMLAPAGSSAAAASFGMSAVVAFGGLVASALLL